VAGLTAFVGFTRRDLDTSNSILIAPRYQPTASVQAGSEDVIMSTLNYDFKLLGYPWSTGWNLSWFNSDTRLTPSFEPSLPQRGRYDLSRVDAGAFLAFHHPFLEPGIEVRRISYSQEPLSLNDYDADDGRRRPRRVVAARPGDLEGDLDPLLAFEPADEPGVGE